MPDQYSRIVCNSAKNCNHDLKLLEVLKTPVVWVQQTADFLMSFWIFDSFMGVKVLV